MRAVIRLLVAAAAIAAAACAVAAPGDGDYQRARVYSGLTGEKLDHALALHFLRQAAAQGHIAAQVDLGFVYFNGNDKVPRDLAAAHDWFRRAAHGGAVIAQCMLGDFHKSGLGGASLDPVEAFRWYQRAATQADRCTPKAQFELYGALAAGRGVKRDQAAAMAWLRKAAHGGNPLAQAELGRAYLTGQGVERDQRLAQTWLKKSREGVAPHDDHDHSTIRCPAWLHVDLQRRAGCAS